MHHRASGASAIEVPEGHSPELVARTGCPAIDRGAFLTRAPQCVRSRCIRPRSFLFGAAWLRARCFQFAHPLLDSLATKVLNQSNRDSFSRAHVVEREIAVVNRPVLERVRTEPRAPGAAGLLPRTIVSTWQLVPPSFANSSALASA